LDSSSFSKEDTIVALATPPGAGAIAVIRISGKDALTISDKLFTGKKLSQQESHTAHFGYLKEDGRTIDEVVATVFRNPRSYTKEDTVEFSCHGSDFIVRQALQAFIKKGARYARAGEFTMRAFLNGRFDLAQAEAVADLIASDSEVSHQAALNQMRGGFSEEIKKLREQLIHFASMIELELDFSEEDVEFANRDQLKELIYNIRRVVEGLIASFSIGNVIKNGVPTVIAGKPNAGKSKLLNVLLNEEKAIVSEIPGTTRDFIEDEIILEGLSFRFIDTAGLRETKDKIEAIGVERTREKMRTASLIIYLFDVASTNEDQLIDDLGELRSMDIPYVVVGNKIDKSKEYLDEFRNFDGIIYISASEKIGIEELKKHVVQMVSADTFRSGNTVVTNIRHYESLVKTKEALNAVLDNLDNGLPGDLLAEDIRQALFHLGEITGEITTDDLLDNIFSKFCIGK
jgi:tRNA modification GTPase